MEGWGKGELSNDIEKPDCVIYTSVSNSEPESWQREACTMRGRDIRLRMVKQPTSQSLAPHLDLPKGILLAVVEGITVTHNHHFVVSNPSL